MAHGAHRKRRPDAELQVGMKHIPSKVCSAGDSAKILCKLKFKGFGICKSLLFCNTILKLKLGLQIEESLVANARTNNQ
jgi:hypothetical protein